MLEGCSVKLEGTLSDILTMKNMYLEKELLVFCSWQINSLIYHRRLYLQKQENKKWRCPILALLVSVKSISLKLEDLFCVLKMISLWTLLHGIAVFLRKMFHFLNIEVVLYKKGNLFSSFITLKAGKANFLPLIYFN